MFQLWCKPFFSPKKLEVLKLETTYFIHLGITVTNSHILCGSVLRGFTSCKKNIHTCMSSKFLQMAVVVNHLVQMRASRVQLPAVTLHPSQMLHLMWTLDPSSSAAYPSGVLTEKRQIGTLRMNICCGIQASASSVQMLKVIWHPDSICLSTVYSCYHSSRMLCFPICCLETVFKYMDL